MKPIFITLISISAYVIADTKLTENQICQPRAAKCGSNDNCCSGFCDKNPGEEFGICKTACGKSVSRIVSNERQVLFPWHAGVYEHSSNAGYTLLCGGSLISHNIVITVAHCFALLSKSDVVDLAKLKVALGKYYMAFNASGDASAQMADVENIEFAPQYQGYSTLYASDIAVLILKTKVQFTRTVRPICVDFGPDTQLVEGSVGKIVGWGFTAEHKPSETLKLAEMAYMPVEECKNNVKNALVAEITEERMCAKGHSNVTACNGDDGGGLVFEDPRTKTYYLQGIFNFGPEECSEGDIVLFTKLSSHIDFIEKFVKNLKSHHFKKMKRKASKKYREDLKNFKKINKPKK